MRNQTLSTYLQVPAKSVSQELLYLLYYYYYYYTIISTNMIAYTKCTYMTIFDQKAIVLYLTIDVRICDSRFN